MNNKDKIKQAMKNLRPLIWVNKKDIAEISGREVTKEDIDSIYYKLAFSLADVYFDTLTQIVKKHYEHNKL